MTDYYLSRRVLIRLVKIHRIRRLIRGGRVEAVGRPTRHLDTHFIQHSSLDLSKGPLPNSGKSLRETQQGASL